MQHIPKKEQEVVDIIRSGKPLRIVGYDSKKVMPETDEAETLSMAEFSGIQFYDPDELVLSAYAGTPLDEIISVLAEKKQMLAFEPPKRGVLTGGYDWETRGWGTLGGCVGVNLSGPRRFKSGACRDYILGITMVNGMGTVIKSGGRVMKNVTGYDLSKLVTGSYGSLGVLTQITMKILPKPPLEKTILIHELTAQRAWEAMHIALSSEADVSGATWVKDDDETVYLRLEGSGTALDERVSTLQKRLHFFGPSQVLSGDESTDLWAHVRDVSQRPPEAHTTIWRVSIPPNTMVEFTEKLPKEAKFFVDWGGGLVWVSYNTNDITPIPDIRSLLPKGGHATIVAGQTSTPYPVLSPREEGVAALEARICKAFDPNGIFCSPITL